MAKSFLMDSIVRGLPVPIIFLRETKTDLKTLKHSREVVDGQQRLRTIISFLDSGALRDYKPGRDDVKIEGVHNKDYAGFSFRDLPVEVQQSILDYEFSVQVFSSAVGDREIIQIFSRMNSTGFKLNPQELRNSQYFGAFKTLMYELATEQLQRWRDWGLFNETDLARMQEVEFTSEFARLMLVGITGRSQKALDTLYRAKDDEFPEAVEVARRFRAVMEQISSLSGAWISESSFAKRSPFYALFAAIHGTMFGIESLGRKVKAQVIQQKCAGRLKTVDREISDATAPSDVLEALSRRTTHPESRKIVTNYIAQSCGF